MPFVRCLHSGTSTKHREMLTLLSAVTAQGLNNREEFVMVNVDHTSNLMFAGSTDPCAMVHVESFSGDLSVIVGPITTAVSSLTGIHPSRIFVNLKLCDSRDWGLSGRALA